MPLQQFTCPKCQTTLRFSGTDPAGKVVRCPKCSTTFRLGAKSAAVTPTQRETTAPPKERPWYEEDSPARRETTAPPKRRPRDEEDSPPPRRRKKPAVADPRNKRLVRGAIGGLAVALPLGGALLIVA